MKINPNYFLLSAVVTSFLFIFTPAVLWIADRLLSKPLETRLFRVSWSIAGIAVAAVSWVVWLILK